MPIARHPVRFAAALVALLAWGTTVGGAHAAPRVDLIFAADLAGDFYGQDCAGAARPGVGLGALASAISAARSASPASLVLGGGGLLGAGGGGRFLLHSVTGSRTAANLLRSAGIEIPILGVQELAIARETLPGYLDQLRGSGPAPLVSNLACPQARPELCRMLATQHVVTRGGLRIGVIAALPEDTAQRVGPGHLHGAEVTPWARLLATAKGVRAQSDVLVVSLDLSSRYGLDEALDLARRLEQGGAHVDLLHVTRQDDPRGGVESMRLTSGTLLFGAPAGGAGVTRVTVTQGAAGEGGAPRIELQSERVLPAGPPPLLLAEALAREQRELCERWGAKVATLPGAGLDRAGVTTLVLDAMRSAARAEIALINGSAISERGLPLRSVTVDTIGSVLPFKAQVLVASLLGQQLAEVLRKHAAQGPEQPLRLAGLALKDGALLINGRPLNPAARYRVATIDFLASGGNGLLPEKFFPSGASVVQDDLRALLLDYLRPGTGAGDASAVPTPLQLERRPLWRAMLDLGVDLQNVTVHNPGGVYDRPQLSRQPSLAYKIDGTVRAEMDQPRHLVQLTLRALYGQSWLFTSAPTMTTPPADPMAAAKEWIGQETADLINLLALYSYRGLSERRPRLPTPYLSLGLESEFNVPDTRTYRHFELSGAVGVRIALPAGISANQGFGVRSELLARGDSEQASERELARARFLVTTTIEMPKRVLWPRLGSVLLGEFLVSYSFTDPTLLRSHELRGLGKIFIELSRPLYLTVGTELYLYRDRDKEAGVALDVTAGLKVLLNGHRQQF